MNSRICKQIYDRKQLSGCLGTGGGGRQGGAGDRDHSEPQGNSGGDRYVWDLEHGSGFMAVHVCQNLPTFTL